MIYNGNQVYIVKKICDDFCVKIFSKSQILPEPVSEPEPEPEGRNRNRKIFARFHNTGQGCTKFSTSVDPSIKAGFPAAK